MRHHVLILLFETLVSKDEMKLVLVVFFVWFFFLIKARLRVTIPQICVSTIRVNIAR